MAQRRAPASVAITSTCWSFFESEMALSTLMITFMLSILQDMGTSSPCVCETFVSVAWDMEAPPDVRAGSLMNL